MAKFELTESQRKRILDTKYPADICFYIETELAPEIRNQALEEAELICCKWGSETAANTIRALKEKT